MFFFWLIAITLLSQDQGYALPSSDKIFSDFDISGIDDASFSYLPYILKDDTNEHAYYIPYNRIRLSQSAIDPSIPDFSLVYLPEGVSIQLGLTVDVDRDKLQPLVKKIRQADPLAKFKYIPIKQGRFIPTIRGNNGIDTYIGEENINEVPHFYPREKKELSFFFSGYVADLIVMTLKNGGGIGINYEYTFDASQLPSSAKIIVDWTQVKRSTNRMGVSESSLLSQRALDQIVRRFKKEEAVSIELVGSGSILEKIYTPLMRLMMDTCFLGVGGSSGSSLLGSYYKYQADQCESTQHEFIYKSQTIKEFVGTAGFQITPLCEDFPQIFSFEGANDVMQNGCPDSIYGSGNVPDVLERLPELQRQEIPAAIF